MARFWTCHWQNRYWRDDVNAEYEPICSSGSNNFRKRGVSVGDVVYIVSLADGQFLLGGRMTVKQIVSRDEAVRIRRNDNLYDAAEWIIDEEQSGTPLNLHRCLAPPVSRQLRFVSSKSEPKGLFFTSDTHLDNQATRGVRELTPESAALLDRIIEITDRLPRTGAVLVVTEEMLRDGLGQGSQEAVRLAEAVLGGSAHRRGNVAPFPDGFNPAIDRYDRRSAARLFRWLWPDPAVARACASNLAASVRTAHEAAEGCWEITMYPYGLRLNVGQVETLTLLAGDCRFLIQAPLELGPDQWFEITVAKDPVYPAVPIPSGVCFVPAANVVSLPTAVRVAHDAYIRAAASYKRVSPFKKSFSPAVLEYLETIVGEPLPRPSYLTQQAMHQRVEPLADELDPSAPICEGAKYQVTVNAYERDPRARQLCIARYCTDCVICGFSFGTLYGEVAEGFIHVHHLRPLSETGGEYEVDPVVDLRPVCPNCHAVLHRRIPAFSIEEVRAFLQQPVRA